MPAPKDLVHDQTTGTGSGNLTLTAVNGKQSFFGAYGSGATTKVFWYYISSQAAAEWETGLGHMSAATTLVRDSVYLSSNANAAVSFTAGTKDVVGDVPAGQQYPPPVDPGGRLTLTSATPVLATTTTAQNTIYYAPYVNGFCPVYNGFDLFDFQFTSSDTDAVGLTLSMNNSANWANGSIYDLFYGYISGTLYFGTGPAWTSATARGTTATSTALQMFKGMQTNKNAITLRTGSTTTQSLPANQGTYLGSMRMTASGQTGMALTSSGTGGGQGVLGVYNAYNKVFVTAIDQDTGATSYTYSGTAWAVAHGSINLSYLDGLGDISTFSTFTQALKISSGSYGGIGVNLNSTNALPSVQCTSDTGSTEVIYVSLTAQGPLPPALGYNTISAMVAAATGALSLFPGSAFIPGAPLTQMATLSVGLMI